MAQDDEDVAVQERPKSEPSVLAPSVPAQSSFATDFPAAADAPNTTTSVTTDSGKPTGSAFDALLPDPAKMQAAGSALLGERQKMGEAQSYVDRESFGRMERDRDQMDRAFKAEGAAASAIPPKWDADKERKDRISGPMEQFGSVGSVFAMAASLFTKTPMTSALRAGAAAMEAIQKSDEKGYESAYKAWKDNTDLALKRFGMEHQMFTDASHLLTTDMSAWAIKQKAIASRFENNTAMIMLENGMYKELIDVQNSQVQAAKQLVDAKKGFEEFDLQHKIIAASNADAPPDETPKQYVQRNLNLLHELKSGARSWQQEALRNFELTNPNATPEQRSVFMQSIRGGAGGKPLTPEQEFTKRFWDQNPGASPDEFSEAFGEFKKNQKTSSPDQKFISEWYAEHPEGTTEEFSKAFGEWKKNQKDAKGGAGSGGNTQLTIQRQNADAVAKQKEVWRKEGMSEDEIAKKGAEMYSKLQSTATPITATNRDQIDSMITRIDTANGAIDKVEALLKKHNAMTGLGGKITRPGEVVSNWFGSNETDRAQFRRYIEELRELGPRLLQESKSRPLASEEKRIAAIVPGLDAGDTTQNTARGLKELQDLFKTLRSGLELRRKGEFQPEKPFGGAAPSKPAPSGGKNPWDAAPIKTPAPDKRSSLDEGRVVSDWEDIPELGQQYAMANKPTLPGEGGLTAEIDKQAGGGFGRGASVPGPSRRQSQAPMSDSEYHSKHTELQQLKGAVMKLGPMREKLTELGATPEQMSKMDAGQAYRFIKERSPDGMGKVNPGWENRNQEFIDRIRLMQDELTSTWQGSK